MKENLRSQLLHYHIFFFLFWEKVPRYRLSVFHANLKVHWMTAVGRKHFYSLISLFIGCTLAYDHKNVAV